MSGPRDSYHHGDLREALLDAGEHLLADRGMKGFTLRECARRAGVSHAAPKHHFGDSEGLLTEIAGRSFRRLTAMLREELARATNLEEEFVATTRAYLHFATHHTEHFRLMFRRDMVRPDDDRLLHAARETFTELTNVILRQGGAPEISLDQLDETVSLANVMEDILIGWSHVHGLAHLKLEHGLAMIPDAEFDVMLEKAARRISKTLTDEKQAR